MGKILKYSKENESEFFSKIDELTDKNQFLVCIETLENIPKGDRDYKISYQLARAYQNFAIVGENEEETEYELGIELLKTSISILESVKEEGQNKAEWNMRMAYGYQYLEDKEELAIPYALRWSELDPSDKVALLVVEECKEKIKIRVKKHLLIKAYEVVESILKSHNIISFNDYWDRDSEELDVIDEEISEGLNGCKLDEEDIMDVIDNVLEDLEKSKKNKNGGNNMEKINHEFFKELDLEKGLKGEFDFGDDTIVLWEEEINGINTTLWYGKPAEITTEILDAFAKFLADFKLNDEKARKALEKYLLEDSKYIVFHKEEIELDVPKDAKEFVGCMKVNNIGLWIDGENTIIVDYMISPEESDEILAVRFNSNFEIMDISWES